MNDLVTPWAVENACIQHDAFVERVREHNRAIFRLHGKKFSHQDRLSVVATLKTLSDEFQLLLKFKTECGYFDGIASAAASYHVEISRIKSGCETLASELLALATRCGSNLSATELLSSWRDWLAQFDVREEAESQLVQELWSLEIGAAV